MSSGEWVVVAMIGVLIVGLAWWDWADARGRERTERQDRPR